MTQPLLQVHLMFYTFYVKNNLSSGKLVLRFKIYSYTRTHTHTQVHNLWQMLYVSGSTETYERLE